MHVEKTIEGNHITLGINGRVDTTTAPILEEALDEHLAETQALVFDCANLEYISSVGLRIFLRAQKTMNTQGTMKLTNVNSTVMEVLDITGFSDILTIE